MDCVKPEREGDKDLGRVPSPLPKKRGVGRGTSRIVSVESRQGRKKRDGSKLRGSNLLRPDSAPWLGLVGSSEAAGLK